MGTITNFAGKYTDPNALNLPPGAAREALNVVSDRPGVAECRMGQEQLSGGYATEGERLLSAFVYGENSIEHTGSTLYSRALSGALTTIGSVDSAGGAGSRLPFAVGGDDLYMATSEGVKVMDGVTDTPTLAGLPAMPDLYHAPNGIITTGTVWLAAGASVAYRAVLLRNDGEGRIQQSAPSGRIVYTNTTSSTAYLRLTVFLPDGAEEGDYLQLFRSTQVAGGVNPGDVLYLSYEAPLTAGNISLGQLTVSDTTPDGLLGGPLYTNSASTFGGITMANNRPPLAQDLTLYRQNLFLAHTTEPHRLQFQMIGTVTPSVAANMEYDVDGHVFGIASGTYGTVSEGVEAQSRLFVEYVNQNTSTWGMIARYVSGENDSPGMIAMERTTPTAGAFTVKSLNLGSKYIPDLTTAISSAQEVAPNGVAVSKDGLFYAFPSNSSYRLRLGRADKRLLRLAINRDSLFAFKEDGVWVIYPYGSGWGYRQISTDVVLQYPDSLAVLDNQVYAFTNRGIVAVDESGIEEVDAPVKNFVAAIRDATLTTAPQSVFAVADSVRLRYYLFYSDGSSGNLSTRALVYNAKTDTWTERDDSTTGGYIGADGLLYLGQGSSKYVRRDRNTGTVADYQDPAGAAIHAVIEWASIISENPSGASRFTEIHLLTEEPTEGPYTFTFTSHYGESESCQPEGENLPEVRMWVPDGVQRTTRLKVRMERDVLSEYFAVLGITNSAKYYRGPATRG